MNITLKHFTRSVLAGSMLASLFSASVLANDALINNSFHPYKDDVPSHDGLQAGMVINQDNLAQFKDIIDPAFANFIEQGWLEVTVGETTSFDLHPGYIEASRNGLVGSLDGHFLKSPILMIPEQVKSSHGTTNTATTGETAPRLHHFIGNIET